MRTMIQSVVASEQDIRQIVLRLLPALVFGYLVRMPLK